MIKVLRSSNYLCQLGFEVPLSRQPGIDKLVAWFMT